MILVVGLGNPGNEYKNTRHNVGFMLIDLLAEGGFDTIGGSKFSAELYKKGSVLLAKPLTFMNLSGKSVKAIKDFYKIDRVIVVHDDLDLKFGAMRFKIGGSSGGHNGLKSIDSLITNEYERVRIGIGKGMNAVSHVLGEFSSDENFELSKILNHAKEAVLAMIDGKKVDEISQKFTLKG